MSQHFLLSAAARTLSLKAIYKMGEDKAPAYENYLKIYPAGSFADSARKRIAELTAAEQKPVVEFRPPKPKSTSNSTNKSSQKVTKQYTVVKNELNTKCSPYRYRNCKYYFRRWSFNYAKKSYAAFAFGRDGCGFSTNMTSLKAAKAAAMSSCRKRSTDCVIYQIVTRK